jgi:hypothetical protein
LIVFEEKDEDCLTNDSEEFRRPRKNRKENRCLLKNFVAAGEHEAVEARQETGKNKTKQNGKGLRPKEKERTAAE